MNIQKENQKEKILQVGVSKKRSGGTFLLVVLPLGLIFLAWFLAVKKDEKANSMKIAGAEDAQIQFQENTALGSEESIENKGDNFFEGVVSEKLVIDEPDAPTKVEGVGNFYTRSKSAIAIDAKTGTILHYQDAKKKTAIASLTKIMTAMVVIDGIENLEEEIVEIDGETLLTIGTRVGCPRSGYCISNRLQKGEKISAKFLLEAVLMNSANDAATALARHIAGSEKDFAFLMNKKAKEIGLLDTNFCNPTGLDEEDRPGGCYSTALDVAKIGAYSLQYEEIWSIMKIKEKFIYSADGKIEHKIINTDLLLEQMDNCLGGKTGFTYEAGRSLMTAAHDPKNKDNIIVAVILDNVYRWEDMKDLINWVFSVYYWEK